MAKPVPSGKARPRGVRLCGIYSIALGQVALCRRPASDALRDGLAGSLKNLLPLLVMVVIGEPGMACMVVFGVAYAMWRDVCADARAPLAPLADVMA